MFALFEDVLFSCHETAGEESEANVTCGYSVRRLLALASDKVERSDACLSQISIKYMRKFRKV